MCVSAEEVALAGPTGYIVEPRSNMILATLVTRKWPAIHDIAGRFFNYQPEHRDIVGVERRVSCLR